MGATSAAATLRTADIDLPTALVRLGDMQDVYLNIAEQFQQMLVGLPAELAKAVKEENAAWGPIVKRVGFTPEA